MHEAGHALIAEKHFLKLGNADQPPFMSGYRPEADCTKTVMAYDTACYPRQKVEHEMLGMRVISTSTTNPKDVAILQKINNAYPQELGSFDIKAAELYRKRQQQVCKKIESLGASSGLRRRNTHKPQEIDLEQHGELIRHNPHVGGNILPPSFYAYATPVLEVLQVGLQRFGSGVALGFSRTLIARYLQPYLIDCGYNIQVVDATCVLLTKAIQMLLTSFDAVLVAEALRYYLRLAIRLCGGKAEDYETSISVITDVFMIVLSVSDLSQLKQLLFLEIPAGAAGSHYGQKIAEHMIVYRLPKLGQRFY